MANTTNVPSTEALRANPHFQTLAKHAPKLAGHYLTAVDSEYAKGKPEHQRAYLKFVTKANAEEPESAPEAPKELSALNTALADALDISQESRKAILAMQLSDKDVTKLMSKMSRQQISGLSGKTKVRRRILKGSPVAERTGRRKRL
jgi:hypothetical protein